MTDRIAALIGAATFAVVETLWAIGHHFAGWKSAWVMKTGGGIALCFAAFIVSAFLVSLRYPRQSKLSKCVLSVTGGGLVALVAVLFMLGAGNLWPIVIVFNGAIILVAALVGAAVGSGFRRDV